MTPFQALQQLVTHLRNNHHLYDDDNDNVLGKIMSDAEQVLEHPWYVQRPVMLQPGVYSVFVLSDDGMYKQPVFHVDQPMSEVEFKNLAEQECDGFISYGVQEDTDCPKDCIRTFTKRD